MGSSRSDRRRSAEARSKKAASRRSEQDSVGAEGKNGEQLDKLKDFGLGQSAQATALVGVVVTFVYLLSLSRGSVPTAKIILAYGGYSAPLVSALTVIAPWMLIQVASLAKIYENTQIGLCGSWRYQLLRRSATIILFSLYIYSFSAPVFSGYLVIYLLGTVYDGKKARKLSMELSRDDFVEARRRSFFRDDVWLIFCVLPGLLGAGLTQYSSQERVSLRGGSVAYGSVIGSKDGYTAILGPKGRMQLVSDESIENRELCTVSSVQPLWVFALGQVVVTTNGATCPSTD